MVYSSDSLHLKLHVIFLFPVVMSSSKLLSDLLRRVSSVRLLYQKWSFTAVVLPPLTKPIKRTFYLSSCDPGISTHLNLEEKALCCQEFLKVTSAKRTFVRGQNFSDCQPFVRFFQFDHFADESFQ